MSESPIAETNRNTTTRAALMPDALCMLLAIYCAGPKDTGPMPVEFDGAILAVLAKQGLIELVPGSCLYVTTAKGRTHVASCCNLALPVSWPSVFGVPVV